MEESADKENKTLMSGLESLRNEISEMERKIGHKHKELARLNQKVKDISITKEKERKVFKFEMEEQSKKIEC